MGLEDLHPVQPVRARVSTRRDSREGLRRRHPVGRAVDVQVDGLPGQRAQGEAIHHSGRAGRLHGLQSLRQRVPGQGPDEPETQSDRHASAGAAPRSRARQLRFLPRYSRASANGDPEDRPQELAVHGTAVRVLGRLRGMRRNAVSEDADAALRRPPAHRQRDRVLVDLRRQPPEHPIHHQSRWPRARLVEFTV